MGVFPPAGQFGFADSACSCFVSAGPPPQDPQNGKRLILWWALRSTLSVGLFDFYFSLFFLSAYDTFPTRVGTHGGTNPVKCTRTTLTHSSDSMVPLTGGWVGVQGSRSWALLKCPAPSRGHGGFLITYDSEHIVSSNIPILVLKAQ